MFLLTSRSCTTPGSHWSELYVVFAGSSRYVRTPPFHRDLGREGMEGQRWGWRNPELQSFPQQRQCPSSARAVTLLSLVMRSDFCPFSGCLLPHQLLDQTHPRQGWGKVQFSNFGVGAVQYERPEVAILSRLVTSCRKPQRVRSAEGQCPLWTLPLSQPLCHSPNWSPTHPYSLAAVSQY